MKRTIRKRIYLSSILALLVSYAIAAVVLMVAAGMYIDNMVYNEILDVAKNIEETVKKETLLELPKDSGTDNTKEELTTIEIKKALVKYNNTIKRKLEIVNLNYILLNNNMKILLPAKELSPDATDVAKNIAGLMKSQEDNKIQKKFKFEINQKPYMALVRPLTVKSGNVTGKAGWQVVYSDMKQLKDIYKMIIILVFALFIVSILIASLINAYVSYRITKPIRELSMKLGRIGERNYDEEIPTQKDEELADLAESAKLMAQKLKDYEKSQLEFFQNMSHELRTPLTSIQGYAESIKFEVAEDVKKASDIIISESVRIRELVEDLLYLSKLDTLRDYYKFERVEINTFLLECRERVMGVALRENKNIEVNSPEELCFINADEDKLSRAFINIISNCVRYAKSKVIITLEKKKNSVSIIIRDDGAGINQEDLPNIFQRSYKGSGGNFGFGLAIAKTIFDKHQGTITVTNDNGAVFIIEI